MAHHQLAELLALERRRFGRLAILQRHALLGQRILRVLRHAVCVQRNLARNGHMRVIHRRDIRRINRHCFARSINHRSRNPERRNGAHRTVGIHNRLRESCHLVGGVRPGRSRVESIRSRVAAKVKVEGAVLLEEHKNVLDPAANQPQLLFLRDRRLFGRVDHLRAHRRARPWRNRHIRQSGRGLLLRRANPCASRTKRNQHRGGSHAIHLPHVSKLSVPRRIDNDSTIGPRQSCTWPLY